MKKNIQKISRRSTRFIQFLGGKNLIYILFIVVLLGLSIFIFDKISYVFKPILIIINTLFAPIIVSLVLFYLINPIINFMEKYKISRMISIIIVYIVLGLIHFAIVTFFGPVFLKQIQTLIDNMPKYLIEFNRMLSNFTQYAIVGDIADKAKEATTGLTTHMPDIISQYLNNLGPNLKSIFETIMSISVVFITVPFILFFMLKDGKNLKHFILRYIPNRNKKEFIDLFKQFDYKVGSYIRGQMIVSLCIGILLFIGYITIGLKYALTLALIAAVTSVVPYLGPMIAISPAIIISLMMSPSMFIKLCIVWTLVQFIEGHFISPNVMGKALKIHPLTIIFVLLCAGKIAGIIGVILGIPGYAVLKVIGSKLFEKFKYRYNNIYGIKKGYNLTNEIILIKYNKTYYYKNISK